MGEYYMWVNASKREYLEPSPFGTPYKIMGSCSSACAMTDALLTLLATDWAGDLVAFVGDQTEIGAHERRGRRLVRDAVDPMPYEYAEDHFTDIAGQFSCARGFTHWVWRDGHPEDPEDAFVEVPIEGTFHRKLVRYRYIINETTTEYYDRMHPANALGAAGEGHSGSIYEDLFPLLLSTAKGWLGATGPGTRKRYLEDGVGPPGRRGGRGCPHGREGPDPEDPFCDGMWIGDVLRPANERPGGDYRDMTLDVRV